MKTFPIIEIIYPNRAKVSSSLKIRRRVGGHFYERRVKAYDLISSTEAVKLLKLSLRQFYRWVGDEKLKPIRRQGRLFFRLIDVVRLAKERGEWPGGRGPWFVK